MLGLNLRNFLGFRNASNLLGKGGGQSDDDVKATTVGPGDAGVLATCPAGREPNTRDANRQITRNKLIAIETIVDCNQLE